MSTTYSEIRAQFEALSKTCEYIKNRANIINRFLEEKEYGAVAFIGSGSSYSVAKSLEVIYKNLSGRAAASIAAGDLLLHTHNYKKFLENSLIVAVSRSGSTSELLGAIREVKSLCSARVIAITCVEDSPISVLADINLTMPWAFDESVCQTRTVSNLYAAGALLIAGITGSREEATGLFATVEQLPEYARRIEERLLHLAKERYETAVVLSDGEIAGVGEEGALAFKEICRVPSNHYGLLDSRHGPIVLFGKGTLVIAALTGACDHEKNLVSDIVNKKALVVTLSDEPVEIPGVWENISFGRPLDIIGRGLCLLVVCQYASYYKALVRGVNPDKPEGLDPWIKL